MFKTRQSWLGIIFAGPHTPGQPIVNDLKSLESVTLKIGDESVLINKIKTTDGANFTGTIYGFEPSFAQKFGGAAIDDDIEFTQANIFSCSVR